jgi:phosphonate transport system permease protein
MRSMLGVSVLFLVVALAAIPAADISLSTLDPWLECKRMLVGLLTPDFSSLPLFFTPLLNTISFALLGITLAILAGSILSLFFASTPVRLFCAFIRSIHEIFWAFLFMPVVGLNSLCGILAIAVPYAGVFAKVYAEIREESNTESSEALPDGTGRMSSFFFTTLPTIYTDVKSYTSYRFECALRSSAILGFVGLPTIGYHLETAFREGTYSEAAALLYLFYLLILSLKFWTKPKILLLCFLAAVFYTSWETSISFANLMRFVTYDILPWPMRAAGYYDGSHSVVFNPIPILQWGKDLISSAAIPGIWNTLVLTQIALVSTAIFTLVSFPFGSSQFFTKKVTAVSHVVFVILRTTPEYILAYIFLQLWGPSMLPAVFALLLHNGGILSHLTALNVNHLQLPFDSTKQKINRYLYEILPRSYGQFLAFLFYRWEVIMRESAILGILGVYTLGFYIDSAISEEHLDSAVLLIGITALLNMGIDTLSQVIRRRVKVSAHISSRCSSN